MLLSLFNAHNDTEDLYYKSDSESASDLFKDKEKIKDESEEGQDNESVGSIVLQDLNVLCGINTDRKTKYKN